MFDWTHSGLAVRYLYHRSDVMRIHVVVATTFLNSRPAYRASLTRSLAAGVTQRMRIVPTVADGYTYREIVDALQTAAPTISLWKSRFPEDGPLGLESIRSGQQPTDQIDSCFSCKGSR